MSDAYLSDLLDGLVTADPPPAWDDVLGRARRSRRRYGLIAVAVATLVVAPATWAVTNVFEGSTPPESISGFAQKGNELTLQAKAAFLKQAADLATADVSKLRGVMQVHTPYGPLDLWAAPSDNGGVCAYLAFEPDLRAGANGNADGSCWSPPLRFYVAGLESPSSDPSLGIADGYTSIPDAATATVTLSDGQSATSPVVEGFYLATFEQLPGEQRFGGEGGPAIVSTTIDDANGNQLATHQGY